MSEQISLQKEKETIEFVKTSDPFISAGISGLIKYCEKRINDKDDIHYEIDGNTLTIEAENLNKVLKEMYLEMGNNFYDTSGQKQLKMNDAFYYDEDKDKLCRFSKVKPRGLALLIHSGQPTAKGKKSKKKDVKQNTPLLFERIKKFCDKNKISFKDDNKGVIWINDRNTNIPIIDDVQISNGERPCSICGEKVRKTYDSISYSPFIGGTSAGNNYVSFLKGAEKICWKCIYLQRFSPVGSFYQYSGDWNVFIFNSDNIDGLHLINSNLLKDIFLTKDSLIHNDYLKNFSFYKFGQDEDKDYFNYPSEQLLMLLYTVYQRMEFANPKIVEKNEWIQFEETLQYKTEVFYLKAKSFGSTLRPVTAETFTDFYYLFSVFKTIEKENINLQHLLWSLKLREGDNRTVLRNKWADQFLHRIPAIKTCEEIVWKNFMSKKYNKDFNQILKWLKTYESIINYGGNSQMNDDTRNLAIKLGSQIGYAAKNDSNPKAGKGKLIMMRKARKISQFLDQIISFQVRYGISINKEILAKIDEGNFDYFRQFTIISALNTFNFKKQENNNEN